MAKQLQPQRRNRRRCSGRERNRDTRVSKSTIHGRQFRGIMTMTSPLGMLGMPDRLRVVLPYSQLNLYSGSALPSAQVFRVNSAFDPDFSGTGHQPSYFDKISAVYGRYYVAGFSLEVHISQQAAATQATEWVVCYSDQNISANTVEELTEAKYQMSGILGLPTGAGAVAKVFMPEMTTQKLMGQPITEPDDNMYADVGANPNDVAWGIIKLQTVDATANVSARIRAILYLDIIFKEVLSQSTS